MAEYKITKITDVKDDVGDDFYTDMRVVGKKVTITNVNNPFDYTSKFIWNENFSREEFKIGRIIEMEAE